MINSVSCGSAGNLAFGRVVRHEGEHFETPSSQRQPPRWHIPDLRRTHEHLTGPKARAAVLETDRFTLGAMHSASEVPRLAVVELTNVRGFKDLTLTLAATDADSRHSAVPRERAAVVIGRNGTNKSTLLRAIAIGVASLSDASAMLSAALGSLIRTKTSQATIRLTYALETGETVVATKEIAQTLRGADEIRSAEGPSADELNLLVCGYGAARGTTGTDPGREYRVFDAVATLFDYRRELLAPELTLRRLADYIGDDERVPDDAVGHRPTYRT